MICPKCGANLVVVTLLAEQHWLGWTRGGLGTGSLRPMSVEQLVPRLGDLLLAQGYITEAQLQEALARRAQGSGSRLLGQILIEMGAVTRETLDRVIARQILELQNALLQANHTLEKNVAERTAELEMALLKLTELNQLKSNIVANISHELRTPLTHIKSYITSLAEGKLGPLTPAQQEAVSATVDAVNRLEQSLDGLIAYAASARGEMTLNLKPVRITPFVEEVLRRVRPAAEQKGLRLEKRFNFTQTAFLGDEEKLFWVLLQLLDNAVKFTPRGGNVTLSVSDEGRRVRFAVQDTGIGIPAGRLEEIFEDVRQLNGSTAHRYVGTGLGLALVRRIVEAHGAHVHVESQEGRGSTFSFAVPASATPPV
ncbi:MAG: HAMP domain-containing sensor histidine kinase [Anaerolineales bacterium]|nr:HAMP domain-containing sensor histidine kinase [Anaerolineales bacterium]